MESNSADNHRRARGNPPTVFQTRPYAMTCTSLSSMRSTPSTAYTNDMPFNWSGTGRIARGGGRPRQRTTY